MVCVVETGIPSSVAANSMIEPPVSAQQPCIGVSRVIFEPIVFTMRQPPASVPSRHRELTGQHHPERHVELRSHVALRIEQDRDDAHGLLGIVAAVPERIERGRDELRPAEEAIDRRTA